MNAPQGVAEEMLSYSHKPKEQWVGSYRDEIPVKENDHSLDMFRYYLKHLETAENYMPGLSSISTVEDTEAGGMAMMGWLKAYWKEVQLNRALLMRHVLR